MTSLSSSRKVLWAVLVILLVLQLAQAGIVSKALKQRMEREKLKAESSNKEVIRQNQDSFSELMSVGQSFSMAGLLKFSRSEGEDSLLRPLLVADIDFQSQDGGHALLTWFSLDFQLSNYSLFASHDAFEEIKEDFEILFFCSSDKHLCGVYQWSELRDQSILIPFDGELSVKCRALKTSAQKQIEESELQMTWEIRGMACNNYWSYPLQFFLPPQAVSAVYESDSKVVIAPHQNHRLMRWDLAQQNISIINEITLFIDSEYLDLPGRLELLVRSESIDGSVQGEFVHLTKDVRNFFSIKQLHSDNHGQFSFKLQRMHDVQHDPLVLNGPHALYARLITPEVTTICESDESETCHNNSDLEVPSQSLKISSRVRLLSF